jgi:D-xylonolactonase
MTNATVDTLATGYGLVEGPRVDPDDRLYFSDVHKGGVYRRDPGGEIQCVVPKRKGVGGIALHHEGGIVISGRDLSHVKDGESRIVFALEDTPGFNDIFTDAQGHVFIGSMRANPFETKGPRETGELYRVAPGGKSSMLYGGVSLTNGIGLSPDGTRLYHSDTAPRQILLHDLAPDGSCSQRRIFASTKRGMPDGLAVDEAGCVWVAAYGGGCVTRFTPEGEVDLHLDVPAQSVTSLCFGGSDRRDLYIASADNSDDPALGGSIFRTRVDTPGLEVALARV